MIVGAVSFYAAHFFHFIACLPGLGAVCDFFNGIKSLIEQIKDLVTNPFGWFVKYVVKPIMDAFFVTPTTILQEAGPIFQALKVGGVVACGVAAVARIIRSLYDERQGPGHVLFDNLFRFGAVFLLINSPALWNGLQWAIQTSDNLALAAIKDVFHGSFTLDAFEKKFVTLLTQDLFGNPLTGIFVAICLIVMSICLLYFGVLMIGRSAMALMAVATAPIFIATAAYDMKNRFCTFWIDMFLGALAMPLVIGLFFGATITMVFNGAPTMPTWTGLGYVQPTLLMIGGAWITGKAINQITWKHFSHSGVTGALTAASTAIMAAPTIAADMQAIGGAAKAAGSGLYKGAGGMGGAFASIPNRRLMGNEGADSALRAKQAGPAESGGYGDGTGANFAPASAAAAGASAASGGLGVDFGAGLDGGMRSGINGSVFTSGANSAIGMLAPKPGQQAQIRNLLQSRPELVSQLGTAMYGHLYHGNYQEAAAAAKPILQKALSTP